MKKTIAAVMTAAMAAMTTVNASDPYLWLEEVESEQALDWVRAQNKRSLAELESDPRFADLYKDALSVLTSDARLAYGAIHNGQVYNFWQDEAHVRGLWRRADVERYRNGEPDWETLIDFDALAKAEGENWIKGDIACLSPAYRHCMIELSDGGKDAAYWREFDLETKTFVEGGFYLPEAKSWLAWVDVDTLLVGTDWGADALTTSGYPRQVRRWKRGASKGDAEIIMTVGVDDVWAFPVVEHDGDDTYEFILRGPSFFEREYHQIGADGALAKLPLPLNADMQGVLDGVAIFLLREDWAYRGHDYAQGSLIGYDLKTGEAENVFAASDSQSIEGVGVGKSSLIVQYLDDVSGKAARFSRNKKRGWISKDIKLPANGVVAIVSAGGGTDDAMVSFENLTTPDSLFYVTAKNKVSKIAETPPFYDATGVMVEQRFATSADGTKVPYFIMGQDAVLKQGNAPTIQYGYGGFLAPILPAYYEDPARPQHGALAGLMWVKRGGVMVLSNIRGGSEYGPRWHEAALKENRQRAFDDFIAISEDLIETGVTSPSKLGIIGRSNGGLLMGAMLTQRPELYAAIDIGVPLFDMKRYNKLLAGASWMGEYGNPDIEEEWAYISKYSPYQNLKADQPYPKVLLYTSTKDDRVHPGHARKAAARLAELGYDFYYYENIEGGHGGTANQKQLARRTALEYVYFFRQLMGEAE
ncbi:Prolyl endopeptidase [hydrothermal vent metagenome]|uniref:Prolyl endopeptidase n=1 Tax=hydrothermal vent metagenome TaxID=652676 RepID=A0A3B0RLN7_9ZZZZ